MREQNRSEIGDDVAHRRAQRETLRFRRYYGEDHFWVAVALEHLGETLRHVGDYREAVTVLRDAEARYVDVGLSHLSRTPDIPSGSAATAPGRSGC